MLFLLVFKPQLQVVVLRRLCLNFPPIVEINYVIILFLFEGPEWVWPVGFFLRAYLLFSSLRGRQKEREHARAFAMAVLSEHFVEVQRSDWRGIPELTQARGRLCPGSNPIQAWSMSCLLEVMADLEKGE